MKRWLRNNSLSIVLFLLFAVFLVGQSVTGYRHYNSEQESHGSPEVTYAEFVKSGEFIETVFENWESEFLQMAAYVVFTVILRQKGSAESHKIAGEEPTDRNPKKTNSKSAPWPVRQGGWIEKVYESSLSIALLLLFAMSFLLHAYGGARATCEENFQHLELECPGVVQYIGTSKFWYESFQNWQSEFLAVGVLVILTIFLRQKHSTQSKPVNAPHSETGS